ncbi:MAG: DUF2232 domain-containing protein [Pseudomonadota bacterium]|nr:DUF2232 domain-containing protein [Pseudomonadota bacterium]
MTKSLIDTLTAGVLTAVLFLSVFGMGLGFLFMFLPTLPLFYTGFGRGPKSALDAMLAAAVLIGAIAGVPAGVFFLLLLGLPAWYISRESLRLRVEGARRKWMPVGMIITHLTLYACALVGLMGLFYAFQPGGVAGLLSQNIHEAFADLEDDYGDILDMLASQWSFLVFPVTIWLWGLALYAHGWVAHRLLRGKALRPDFAVGRFSIPGWMLWLLAICGLASLIGSPSMSLVGKSTLISLMLPYFFSGTALMHDASRSWPNRRFFLFFIYFVIFAQFWPALALSGVGLWHQIKCLSAAEK